MSNTPDAPVASALLNMINIGYMSDMNNMINVAGGLIAYCLNER